MSLKIEQSPAAVADILQIADYLAEQASLNTSDKFLSAATQTYRKLADMPGMGVQRSYNNPLLAGMRRFPISGFPKYLVFYHATDTELRILRVIHGARNIEQIFNPSEEPLDED